MKQSAMQNDQSNSNQRLILCCVSEKRPLNVQNSQNVETAPRILAI